MGPLVYLGLCFLGCFTVGSSGTAAEDDNDENVAPKSPCPSGAIYFRQNCYEYVGTSMTWDSAEAACQRLRRGGHLASFSSLREEKMISAHIRSHSSVHYVWIGLNAVPNSYALVWEWSDGTPYISGSPLWDNRRPSTSISSSECLMLYNVQYPSSSTRWSQYPCDNHLPFVCKYKP